MRSPPTLPPPQNLERPHGVAIGQKFQFRVSFSTKVSKADCHWNLKNGTPPSKIFKVPPWWNTKPSATSHGLHFVRSVLCDFGLSICQYGPGNELINRCYCLTACLYAKCCNLIGWILELGPFIHFRIDGPVRLYGFRSKLKHRTFGKMVEKLSTEVVKC